MDGRRERRFVGQAKGRKRCVAVIQSADVEHRIGGRGSSTGGMRQQRRHGITSTNVLSGAGNERCSGGTTTVESVVIRHRSAEPRGPTRCRPQLHAGRHRRAWVTDGALNGTGNALANILTGTSSNNQLSGWRATTRSSAARGRTRSPAAPGTTESLCWLPGQCGPCGRGRG